MPKHVKHPFNRHESMCDSDPSGKTAADPDFGWAVNIAETTCHRCLDGIIRMGEKAVARIIALDTVAAEVVPDKIVSEPVIVEDKVLVHADGGRCHGVALQGGQCPSCRLYPDMQSTALWPRSRVKYTHLSRDLNGDSW